MADVGTQAGPGLAELSRSGSRASRPGSATSRLARPTSAHSPPASTHSSRPGSARGLQASSNSHATSFARRWPQLQQLVQLKAGGAPGPVSDEALINRLAALTGSELVDMVSVQHQPSVAAALADRGMADEFAKKHNRWAPQGVAGQQRSGRGCGLSTAVA